MMMMSNDDDEMKKHLFFASPLARNNENVSGVARIDDQQARKKASAK